MTRARRMAAVMALGWLALGSGCAGRAAEPSTPAEEPAETPAGGAPVMQPGYAQPPADLEREGADSSVAKDDDKNGRFDNADDARAAFERSKLALDEALSDAQQLASASACHNACSALGSMRRSVDALCDLAGDDDSRCQDARGVLETSSRRVDEAGCRC